VRLEVEVEETGLREEDAGSAVADEKLAGLVIVGVIVGVVVVDVEVDFGVARPERYEGWYSVP